MDAERFHKFAFPHIPFLADYSGGVSNNLMVFIRGSRVNVQTDCTLGTLIFMFINPDFEVSR